MGSGSTSLRQTGTSRLSLGWPFQCFWHKAVAGEFCFYEFFFHFVGYQRTSSFCHLCREVLPVVVLCFQFVFKINVISLLFFILIYFFDCTGLPRWLNGKEPTRQCKRCGLDPWVGKIPWKREWQPTPVFLPGKSLS